MENLAALTALKIIKMLFTSLGRPYWEKSCPTARGRYSRPWAQNLPVGEPPGWRTSRLANLPAGE